MDENKFQQDLRKIYGSFSKIPKDDDTYEEVKKLSKHANKLNTIAKKMNKMENMTIRDLIINFSRYLYDIIDDISILLSNKKYKVYKKWIKNRKYNNWWIPMINHIRVLLHIFTKNNRILYFGILLVLLSIFFYFISITK